MTTIRKDSIATFVLAQYDLNPKIGTNDLISKVLEFKSTSKFNAKHVAWYRSQIRHGIYKERVNQETRNVLGLLRSTDIVETSV